MSSSLLDPQEPDAPSFAVRPTTREEVHAWEQLSELHARIITLFAEAAPYIKALEAGLRAFATNAEVKIELLHDSDWKIAAPTIVVRYTVQGEWTPARLTARDAALQMWYDAPHVIRISFPPLREDVTIQEANLTLL